QLNQEFDDGSHAKETLPESPVVLVQYYLDHKDELDEAFPEGLWVLDTDGYAYWTQALLPGEATNLLLDNVVLDENVAPDDNYYYAIDVRLEASNLTESYLLYSGDKDATANGEKIIKDAVDAATPKPVVKVADHGEIVDARDYILPTEKTGDSAEWMAIARQVLNGEEYYLIVRRESVEHSQFDYALDASNDYTDSILKTAMDDWWEDFSGPLKETYAVAHNALSTLGTGSRYFPPYTGFSSPSTSGTSDGVFPLSANEAAKYMSVCWYDESGSNIIYNTSDGAEGGVPLTAYTNWETLTDKESRDSWLRSPEADSSAHGTDNHEFVAVLSDFGSVECRHVGESFAVRPALWVSADIFA
ncbi:MAG: DUF6273 domain-containing protein, partial [Oscillospiraceae bacterium]|nr:DUF6273 domain-containing protein [Oscillospiraceae bacterium]